MRTAIATVIVSLGMVLGMAGTATADPYSGGDGYSVMYHEYGDTEALAFVVDKGHRWTLVQGGKVIGRARYEAPQGTAYEFAAVLTAFAKRNAKPVVLKRDGVPVYRAQF